MKYTIDATGKKLGRVASQAAVYLRGKQTPDFTPNRLSGHTVHITNASKLSLSEKKLETKKYIRHSGYPGGQHSESIRQVIDKKGRREVLRRAVLRMLPNNTLRPKMMKQLTIEE